MHDQPSTMPRHFPGFSPLLVVSLIACARAPRAPVHRQDRSPELNRSQLGGLEANRRIPDTVPVLRVPEPALPALATAFRPRRTLRDSISLASAIRKGFRQGTWPAGPDPSPYSILPAKRIVAFYGNPLSPRMGILGEIAPERMLARLDTITREWHDADPDTPVQPALHLITVVAQEKPGRDGQYRIRMDSALIEKVYRWAQSRNAILFLDIQAGYSTIEQELPRLLPWLTRPDIHLGIDPEFYMHYRSAGHRPGKRIGTLTGAEVNHAIETLAKLVDQYHLPPKVLVVHRFTRQMLQDASAIRLDPRVQVVINMDGWGEPWLKFDSYALCQVAEPVQFTGFKLFFRNDTKTGHALLTPREVLTLRPRPVYIQYQ